MSVGSTPALPGTLTLPKTAELVPGVVLVQGSGPNDEDESIGAVKVFKDLAWGLATRNIAVLRYIKRSRVSPSGILSTPAEYTQPGHVDEVVVNDVAHWIRGETIQ